MTTNSEPAVGEAMRNGTVRAILSSVLAFSLPVSMFAADSTAAMLYTNGTAWINGGSVPRTSAIFSGDLVQTKADSVASIKAPGSSVLVSSDSLVQYQGDSVKLEHGGMDVATSKSMAARIGGLKVVPASGNWTEFEVRDTDGAVKIIARKGTLTLIDADGTTTLGQGQETTRDETQEKGKKKRDRGAGAVPAAGGGILDSPIAIGLGAGAVTGLTVWVLLQNDDPLSPKDPRSGP
jgi:hypothetical protein